MEDVQFNLGCIKPFHPSIGTYITHLLYKDDILISSNDGKASIRNVMDILHKYEGISGQQLYSRKVFGILIFFDSHDLQE